jgi:hypothetical protein
MKIKVLNQLDHHKKGTKEELNRGNESICVVIHMYIEMSQENALYSYLKKAIISFFSFFFY